MIAGPRTVRCDMTSPNYSDHCGCDRQGCVCLNQGLPIIARIAQTTQRRHFDIAFGRGSGPAQSAVKAQSSPETLCQGRGESSRWWGLGFTTLFQKHRPSRITNGRKAKPFLTSPSRPTGVSAHGENRPGCHQGDFDVHQGVNSSPEGRVFRNPSGDEAVSKSKRQSHGVKTGLGVRRSVAASGETGITESDYASSGAPGGYSQTGTTTRVGP